MNILKSLFYSGTFISITVLALVSAYNNQESAINSENLIIKNGLICIETDSLPFTGIIQDVLDNNMKVFVNVADGLMNGKYLLFDINGKLTASGYMVNNMVSGTWQYFYENGQLQCEGTYSRDEPNGKWTWYYENGSKKCEGLYSEGRTQGRWIKYNEQGLQILILNFHYGELLSFVEINKSIII